jgi:hypothetical protein
MRYDRAKSMNFPGQWRLASLLALVPLLGAAAGALVDERTHLGFTNWRAACRAAGLTLSSLLTFTAELLPGTLIGMLGGGIVVLLAGLLLRHREGVSDSALAAHGGCAAGMTAGLWLCTLAVPTPMLLVAEGLLSAAAAAWLCHRLHSPSAWKPA